MDFFPSEEHRRLLLVTLQLHHVTDVIVSFDGSGDSGSVNDVRINCANPEKVAAVQLIWPEDSQAFVNGQWVHNFEECHQRVDEILKRLTYDALEQTRLDWYNNDGGFGELTIDFNNDPATVNLNVSIRVVSTTDHVFGDDEEGEG